MTPKEVVSKFYKSDLANNSSAIEACFHKDCIIDWHSSKGFKSADFNTLKHIFEDIRKTYETLRFEISHMLQDGNSVMVRYTSYVSTIENPNEEEALAHFSVIWEVRDDKIIKGYQMSQLADNSADSLNSFS